MNHSKLATQIVLAINEVADYVDAQADAGGMVCTLCGDDAKLADDGFWRHLPNSFLSTFCDKYGYPIDVRPAQAKKEGGG